jgi:malonyl CoA-acyl carrier protein transacylase
MATALIFPGQGAPAAEWREATAGLRPDLIERASALCGEDPFERLGESTEYDQPAIYCATITALGTIDATDSIACAGHSLGEVAALVAGGALDESDGLRIVAERGRVMAAAAADGPEGGMLAVRAPAGELATIAERHGVGVANLNTSSQTVLSGPLAGIGKVAAELAEGQTLVKRLRVAGAFHSPQMTTARAGIRSLLAEIEFIPPAIPVISCRTAAPFTDPAEELALAMTEPVDWVETVAALDRLGVDRYVEVGPGRALAGMVRTIIDGAVAETTPVPVAAGA